MTYARTEERKQETTRSGRQRRRGVWQLRWETGAGEGRLYHSETIEGTKTEAEAVRRERLAEKERARSSGTLSTDPKQTVGEWLRKWLDEYAVHNVRPLTLKIYRGIVERELVRSLGDIRLTQLGVTEVQPYLNVRRQRHSPRWLQRQPSVLRTALAESERQGLVGRNVARLNQESGHRRLNVAVTRARRRMTVVSSFSGREMDPDRLHSEGARMLRDYLLYAESGGVNLGLRALSKPALNTFERDVQEQLTAQGMRLLPQFGASGYWIDFAVMHPDRPSEPIIAIEADGASYHSSPSARDRDRLRQEHLERLGWHFHRIWSTD